MLPAMRYRNSVNQYVITGFGGINTSFSQRINELTDARNMSSLLYPAISSERDFEKVRSTDNIICSAGYFDRLYTIERTDADTGSIYLCSENLQKEIGTFDNSSEACPEHKIEFTKDAVFITPENIIYHTDTGKLQQGNVSQTITEETAQAKFESESLTDKTMTSPYNIWYSAYLTSNSVVFMKSNYTASSATYTFYTGSLSSDFEVGDVITLKMNVKPIDATQDSTYRAYTSKMQEGITLKIKELTQVRHSSPAGYIYESVAIIFDDNTVDMGGYDEVFVFDMTVEKSIPEFVDICSFENRMWGVTQNELCTSKLGDPSEWNDFTVDAYGTLPSSCFKTEVESDGQFTAIAAYNGNILAFKEDCIYKVYGSEPAEYNLTRINCPGVKRGCRDTLSIVNGTLYYMSRNGIYAFNGSTVELISTGIDISSLSAGTASGDERFYFIELFDNVKSSIYVYDTMYGVWHVTDCPDKLTAIVLSDEKLLFVCQNGVMEKSEGFCSLWRFEMSFAKKEFASKHICSVLIRYFLEDGGSFAITLENKHNLYTLAEISEKADNKMHLVSIPVSCSEDAMLRFEGKGKFILSSLTVRYKETGIND